MMKAMHLHTKYQQTKKQANQPMNLIPLMQT